MTLAVLGWLPLALAVAAVGYTVHAIVAVRRFARTPPPPPAPPEPVTLLKPLHGGEPRLAANLATFLDQDWPAAVQMVAGTNRPDDPALAVARALPGTVALRTDAAPLGANAKVANLANLLPAAAHDLLVMSDSDMAVPRDYLARVAAALAQPGVGAVTCLYRGRGDAGFWSVLGAAAVSYQFLPQVLVSRSLGDRRACMGSTIALRRSTLAAIGGFEAFADLLADDHAIGAAVRALGRRVAMPPLVLVHAATERSLAELWRHELRWAATVRAVVSPGQYAGIALTQPLPWALLACPLLPRAGLAAVAVALASRAALTLAVDRLARARTAPLWLLPLREALSFAVFAASLFVRSVDWRGQRLRMTGKGRIAGPAEPPST